MKFSSYKLMMMGCKIWVILVFTIFSQVNAQEEMEQELTNITTTTTTTTATPSVENRFKTDSSEIKTKSVASALNSFGYKLLLKMMNEKKDENIVISPIGISSLLAMTLLGSVGRTYDELAETLGFSQDIFTNRKNHEQVGKLLHSLNTNVSSKTLFADSMFVDLQTPLRELYHNYLRDVYRSEILGADFKKTEDAKNMINEWVKNHTEGQIDNFLKESLPESTKLVLLTALYFKGQWEHPFVAEYTAKMPFKTQKGDVMVDLMLNFGKFPYMISQEHDFMIIALPYNDSETTMYALKPLRHKILDLPTVMEQIDYDIIEEAIHTMTSKKCIVRFPKLELKSSVSLEKYLKSIGIKELFKPGKANLALMVNGNMIVNKTEDEIIARIENSDEINEEARSVKNMLDSLPNPGIHVDSVIHDVKISINEYGTEAVAATSAILARTAEQFYADSPFYIFIRNSKTKLVTFSAVIVDPTLI